MYVVEKETRRFDEFGRIVIPRDIRERLFGTTNVEGVGMSVSVEDGAIVLRPINE